MANRVLFDRYRLLAPAGAGGTATVWRALDEQTGDVVAVKRLHPIVVADTAARRRLERESVALRALESAHIVGMRDLRVSDDEAALVLDYVEGTSLSERLAAHGRLSVAETIAVVRDIASALMTAHAAGVVHRDVKPGNVIIAEDGRALLTDFGIARDGSDRGLDPAVADVTATGDLVGSFRYMAPEVLRGAAASPAADQYALAAVAYEMLSGRPPYSGATPVALAEEQAADPPALEDIDPTLAATVMRGLAPESAQRFPDVAAFARSLEQAVRPASPSDETRSFSVVGDGPRPAPDDIPARARPIRSPAHLRWLPFAGLAALGLAAVLVVGGLGAAGRPPDRAAQSIVRTPAATPAVDTGEDADPPGRGNADVGEGGRNGNDGQGQGKKDDKGKGKGRGD